MHHHLTKVPRFTPINLGPSTFEKLHVVSKEIEMNLGSEISKDHSDSLKKGCEKYRKPGGNGNNALQQ